MHIWWCVPLLTWVIPPGILWHQDVETESGWNVSSWVTPAKPSIFNMEKAQWRHMLEGHLKKKIDKQYNWIQRVYDPINIWYATL